MGDITIDCISNKKFYIILENGKPTCKSSKVHDLIEVIKYFKPKYIIKKKENK